jgi:hypothetical protein
VLVLGLPCPADPAPGRGEDLSTGGVPRPRGRSLSGSALAHWNLRPERVSSPRPTTARLAWPSLQALLYPLTVNHEDADDGP